MGSPGWVEMMLGLYVGSGLVGALEEAAIKQKYSEIIEWIHIKHSHFIMNRRRTLRNLYD